MKITFLNEAGPFGSYKKRNKTTIIDAASRDMFGVALDSVVEARIDELAEVYLSMLNEIDSIVNSAFSKFTFNNEDYSPDSSPCNMHILFNYAVSKNFKNDKNVYLNILKHVYCNRFAIEYMANLNNFYIPIIDTCSRRYGTTQFYNASFDNIKEFCNIISKAGKKTEKILKKYGPIIKDIVPSLPNIPTSPKFINIDCNLYYNYYLRELYPLYNSAGMTVETGQYLAYHKDTTKIKSDPFKYPGKMKDAIQEMMKFDTIPVTINNIEFHKAYEKLWNSIQSEIPYLHNKLYFASIKLVSISDLAKYDFYGLKMLKHLIDNKVVLPNTYVRILAPSAVFTNLNEVIVIKKFIDSNNLTNMTFNFDDSNNIMEYFASLGKKMTPKDVEKEGIDVNSLKRSVYEFDYSNPATVKAAATTIINGVIKIKNGSDSIKQVAINKLEEFIPTVMAKVAASKPNCINSTNKILLCDFHQNDNSGGNFRVEIRQNDITFNKKNDSIIIYIEIQFKVPVRGVNPNYNNKNTSQRTSGKNYEFISGKKIKLELPL